MKTTAEQFATLLSAPEAERLEFKEAKNDYTFDKLVDYTVALANEGGGKIILGVTDKRPRTVIGTAAFQEPGRTASGLYDRLHHRIPIEEYFHEGQRVLIFHVPSRLPGTAWANPKGHCLKRAGDSLVGITPEELKTIFAETGPDFSAEFSGASLDDLDAGAIAQFQARWAIKDGNTRIGTWNIEEALTASELLVDGRITYAALLLFGTRTALGRHLAQAETIFEYRSSEASGPAQDREEYREGFFLYFDRIWEKINLRNDLQSYQEGLFRYAIRTFDQTAVREALLNAVTHRDYRLGGSVFVRQFSRRLEIISPGGFPSGITPDNILEQQNPRNRRLAEAFARCGLIERAGQGINLMFEAAVLQSKALPSFRGSSTHEVRLTLEGTVRDPSLIQFFERVGEARYRSFSTLDFLAIDAVKREDALEEALQARIPSLIEAGILESTGRGRGVRYLLSRGLSAALGKKGTYTRKKGLDHETHKELLLKHLRDNAETGAPVGECCQVLPELSKAAVQSLLQELREEGRVEIRGQRRGARWFLINTPAAGNKEAGSHT